ncbi:hypothetical protein KC957_00595 [Candidatus Saccharibacteria bacterium]|nr:hypothetical protein [Candidatus Saccharibacteria bacterium]
MDELLQKAPEAHDHLQHIADPGLQEELGAKLLELGHVELYDVRRPDNPHLRGIFGEGPTYSPVAEAEYSPEQREGHERISALITQVAEVTSVASRLVEERKEASPDETHFYGSQYNVYEVAKELAYDQALTAFEGGDKEQETRALETMFAVALITPGRGGDSRSDCELQIRHGVAAGMATDIIEVAQGMRGVVAVTDDFGSSRVRSVPECVEPAADLLRVAANNDFDDQLQHPKKLVAEGLPSDDVAKRSEMIAGLPAAQIAALSRLAGEKLSNGDFAADLAIQAVKVLTQKNYSGYNENPVDVAEVVGVLMDYAAHSRAPATVRQADEQLQLLRRARSAGLHPYRTNNPMTSLIDRAMVLLAAEGRTDAIKALISSAPKETPAVDRAPTLDENGQPQEPDDSADIHTNLGWALHVDGRDMSPQEVYRIKRIFSEAHREKEQELRQALELAGATPETTGSIIASSSDPDSALAITPEFWDMYNEITGQGEHADSARSGSRPGPIRNMIESGQSHDLGKLASAIEVLLTAGLSAEKVSDAVILRLNKLQDETARGVYLAQLVETVNELQETYEGVWSTDAIVGTLSMFEEPATALALAKKLYGDEAFDKIYGLQHISEKSYIAPFELVSLDPDRIKIVEYISEHSSDARTLLSEMSTARYIFLDADYEDVVSAISRFESSETLRELAKHSSAFTIYRELLVVPSGPGTLGFLEEAFAGSDSHRGIKQLVDSYRDNPYIQKLLVGQLLNGDSGKIFERADEINNIFGASNMTDLIARMPDQVDRIFKLVSNNAYDSQKISDVIAILDGDALRTLTEEYVTTEAGSFIMKDILEHEDPVRRAAEILQLYEDLYFIQQTGININFAAHIDQWREFVADIPEGKQGERMRQQVVERLKLSDMLYPSIPFTEDPTQAIRIFTEVGPSRTLSEAARVKGFELVERLYRAETTRGFPSAKPGKLAEVFFDDEIAAFYSQLYALKQAGDADAIEGLLSRVGYDSTRLTEAPDQDQTPLAEFMLQLRGDVGVLRKQRKDAELWLGQYAKQPIKAVKLIGAWKSRPIAQANGIKDNPRDILNFVAEKGVMIFAGDAMTDGRTEVTPEEFLQYDELIAHVGSTYSPAVTFGAIERIAAFKREHGSYPAKIMPAVSTAVVVGDETYAAEILSPDDPRGLTIGFDTGCCMTLGGASDSCIWAGYEDARYSFFAVYDSAGKLRAQSVMYVVEEDDKSILVVDNIEANQGTNLGKVADVYRTALVEFIQEKKLDISAIHIGVGYTPAEVMKQLPKAPTSPATPLPDVYSDAASQRLLWSREASPVS